jgi:hypothetical protein
MGTTTTTTPSATGAFSRVLRHYAEARAHARLVRPLTIATVSGSHLTGHVRSVAATSFELDHGDGITRLTFRDVAAIYDENPRNERLSSPL